MNEQFEQITAKRARGRAKVRSHHSCLCRRQLSLVAKRQSAGSRWNRPKLTHGQHKAVRPKGSAVWGCAPVARWFLSNTKITPRNGDVPKRHRRKRPSYWWPPGRQAKQARRAASAPPIPRFSSGKRKLCWKTAAALTPNALRNMCAVGGYSCLAQGRHRNDPRRSN
jgi:hypothetical protein